MGGESEILDKLTSIFCNGNTKNLTVGNLKTGFSAVLREVEAGEEVIISYGKSKKKIAVIVPFKKYFKMAPRKLGLLAKTGSFQISKDFEQYKKLGLKIF